LLLRNKDQQNSLAVSVSLFSGAGHVISSSAGQAVATAQLQLSPHSTKQIALANLLPADGAMHTGGLAVQFNASAIGLVGQVMITNPIGNSINLPLSSGYTVDTDNALYAPWWLSDANTDGSVQLFNSSNQPLAVTPSLVVDGVEQAANPMSIAPNASQVVSLRRLLGQVNQSSATMGSLTLRYTATPHALQPSLVLVNSVTGSWLTVGFHARRQSVAGAPAQAGGTGASPSLTGALASGAGTTTTQAPTRWEFAELKLKSSTGSALHGYVLLSNGTNAAMNVGLEAHFASTRVKSQMQTFHLPVVALASFETRVVDISQFVTSGTIPGNPQRLALVASHPGAPGDLAINAFSVDSTNTWVFPSPGSLISPAVVDISYFQVSGGKESPRSVRNSDPSATQGQIVLYFPTSHGLGSYHFPVMPLPANSDQKIKLGQITRVPDSRGFLAPKGTTAGIAVLLPVAAGASAIAAPQELCESSCTLLSPASAAVSNPSDGTVNRSVTVPNPNDIIIITVTHHIHFNENQTCNLPEISISPASGAAGDTVSVTISGDFLPQDFTIDAGDQIIVMNAVWQDENTITADFETDFDPAAVADWPVTVTGPFGQSNAATFSVTPPAPPVIESITPTSGQAGNLNLPVRIDMTAAGRFHDEDTIKAGVINIVSPTASPDGVVVNATFQIPLCGAGGDQQVTVTDPFGQTSNGVTFQVDPPPPPHITSVSPTAWTAGATNLQVTIQGTGFDCPSVRTTDPAHVVVGPINFNPEPGTTITANVNVDANTPTETITLFVDINDAQVVESNGVPITIAALPTPQPLIVFGSSATACSGTPQNLAGTTNPTHIVAGQKIPLVACINGIDSRITLTGESWTSPSGTAVAGFTNGSGGGPDVTAGHMKTITATSCANGQAQCVLAPFYWVCATSGSSGSCTYPGTAQISFQYQPANSSSPISATAQFSVDGPTNVDVHAVVNPVEISSANPTNGGFPLVLQLGDFPTTTGITFTAAGNFPAGDGINAKFIFVQVLDPISFQYLLANGTQTRTLNNPGEVLDTTYPYANGNNVDDSPSTARLGNKNESEQAESMDAKMWLLWDPALKVDGTQCHAAQLDANDNLLPSTCDSIPIPLGYTLWHWSGNAVSTLDTVTPPTDTLGWRAGTPAGQPGCRNPSQGLGGAGQPAGPAFTHQNFVFPDWITVVSNATGFTCTGVGC
jgi:hypothetical protein